MADIRQAGWLRYVVLVFALVVTAEILQVLPISERTPGQSLLWVVAMALPMVAFRVVTRVWPFPGHEQVSKGRWSTTVLLIFGLLAIEFVVMPSLDSLHSHNPRLAGVTDRLVEAGGGWLLPALILATFITLVLLRRRRSL